MVFFIYFFIFLPTTRALARSIEFRHPLSCVYFALLFWRVWQMLITCVALKARETCHVLPRKRRTKHIFFFFRMEFYYKSYCCFGPRHGVLLQPASINHLTATLHILVPYILCFCPQKYYGLPRGRDSQFWQRTLGSTSNTNWTCCRFNPRINLKPDNGPRSWSCSVEWRLRFEKNKIKNRVAEQRANSKFKK